MRTLGLFLLILLLISCAPENTDEVVRGKEVKPLDNPVSLYCKNDRFILKEEGGHSIIPEGNREFFLDFYIEGIITNRNYRLRQIWGTYDSSDQLTYYVDLKNIYIGQRKFYIGQVYSRQLKRVPIYIINRETLKIYDHFPNYIKMRLKNVPYRDLVPYQTIAGQRFTKFGDCKIIEEGLAYDKYQKRQKKLRNAEENRLKDYQEELKKQREMNKI